MPVWHISTPEGQFVILTRFDPDKPDQRERMLTLVPRFMAWKLGHGIRADGRNVVGSRENALR